MPSAMNFHHLCGETQPFCLPRNALVMCTQITYDNAHPGVHLLAVIGGRTQRLRFDINVGQNSSPDFPVNVLRPLRIGRPCTIQGGSGIHLAKSA